MNVNWKKGHRRQITSSSSLTWSKNFDQTPPSQEGNKVVQSLHVPRRQSNRAGEEMRKCSGRDLGCKVPDIFAEVWKNSRFHQRFLLNMLRKNNMAPGKTHVHSKHKNKLHSKRKSSSGVKKAKKNTLSNKQVTLHVIFLKEWLALVNGDTSMLWFLVADKLLDAKLGGVCEKRSKRLPCHAN